MTKLCILIITACSLTACRKPEAVPAPAAQATRDYARRHIKLADRIDHVIFVDGRKLPAYSRDGFKPSPTIAAGPLVYDYLKDHLGPGISIESTGSEPDPDPGDRCVSNSACESPAPLPTGALYVRLDGERSRNPAEPANRLRDLALNVLGNKTMAERYTIRLDMPSPGDIPCSGSCETPEEIFHAIRGRLDALIARINRKPG